jgi:hypothetical protein
MHEPTKDSPELPHTKGKTRSSDMVNYRSLYDDSTSTKNLRMRFEAADDDTGPNNFGPTGFAADPALRLFMISRDVRLTAALR